MLLEFRRSVDAEGGRWLEGLCITFGKNIPYLPVIDLVKEAFGVLKTDAVPQIVARIDETASASDAAGRTTSSGPFCRRIQKGERERTVVGADVRVIDSKFRRLVGADNPPVRPCLDALSIVPG